MEHEIQISCGLTPVAISSHCRGDKYLHERKNKYCRHGKGKSHVRGVEIACSGSIAMEANAPNSGLTKDDDHNKR